jgi:hypothetical protein
MKTRKPIFLSWVDESGEARSLYFDLAFSDAATHSSEITKYPVEQGANVADHVRVNPLTLSASVFISNTPIDDLPDNSRAKQVGPISLSGSPLLKATSAQVAQFTDTVFYDGDFIAGTYAILRSLHDEHQIMTATTPIKNYQNMVLTKVELMRDKDNSGDGAKFEIDLEQITIVTSDLVTSATVPQAQPDLNKGQNETGEPDAGDVQQSVLLHGLVAGVKAVIPGLGSES